MNPSGPRWVLVALLGVPQINPGIKTSANAARAVVGPLRTGQKFRQIQFQAPLAGFAAHCGRLEQSCLKCCTNQLLGDLCYGLAVRTPASSREHWIPQESETHGHRRVKNAARASLNLILSYLCPQEERMHSGIDRKPLLPRVLISPVFSHSLILALVFSVYAPG